MARLFYEGFEGTGFELGALWSKFASGASSVDEDASTASAGSPPLWGSQCLEIVHASGAPSFAQLDRPASIPHRSVAFECVVTAASFADGTEASILQSQPGVGTSSLWRIRLLAGGGVTSIAIQIRPDGNAGNVFTTVWDEPLVLDKLYRFSVLWNENVRFWQAYVSGRLVAQGDITADAIGVALTDLLLGTTTPAVTFTVYIDRLEADDSEAIDSRNARSLASTQRAG